MYWRSFCVHLESKDETSPLKKSSSFVELTVTCTIFAEYTNGRTTTIFHRRKRAAQAVELCKSKARSETSISCNREN